MKIDILAIVAHPDDAELCCAGTLIKHKQKGYTIGIVDLTRGELGSRGSADLRDEEARQSAKILRLNARENLDLGDGTFQNNPETQLKVIEQIRRFQPEIVITNAKTDRHPDHGRGAKLVADACFFSGLIKIESSFGGQNQVAWRPKQLWHMTQDFYHHPDIVIDITEQYQQKLQSIEAFASQFYTTAKDGGPQTPISSEEFWHFLEARSRDVGRTIGVKYAEGFVRSRVFGVENLFDLV